jgi:Cell Wall Hydrolase
VALHVMLGLNKPVTNKATHYHTDYVNPYWAPSLVETAEIGTHIFYRFPRTTKEWTNARMALAASRAQDQELMIDDGSDVDGMDAMLEDVPAEALQSLITVSIDNDDVPAVATKAVATKTTDSQPL